VADKSQVGRIYGKHSNFRDGIETRVRHRVIRMCGGENRLKAEAGMVPFPQRKESEAGNRANFPRWAKLACFRNHRSDHSLVLSSRFWECFIISAELTKALSPLMALSFVGGNCVNTSRKF
jgi:hypothetical protein